MTLDDLITKLQEIAEDAGGETPVYLATQPHYPFASTIGEVVFVRGTVCPDCDGEGWTYETDEDAAADRRTMCPHCEGTGANFDAPGIYVGEGSQQEYLDQHAVYELGWNKR